ncbi:STAS/SEC14 domain-containing protein [Paenibacillus sp. F6_3S_P_1C]|uniref:STAS/SEC14 domain-containing protein n=1 Tax=Paenibacillus vandeheii TaxID=3035917 RepID=A0ABT8JLG4_9BACL|nr:STAS/SEC14 domain-containing protein [Paenibacillus vandeheii]MDN4605767.1 STAS/SEC14 domain-containing protein [Paenibacillus vandeheii]
MSVKRLDSPQPIIEIVWEGMVSPEQVEQTNNEIKKIADQLGNSFDLLVDMRNMKAFPQDTKEKMVEHQKLLAQWGMKRASVAVGGAIAKMQLNRISKESQHQTEFQWETIDEALAFLLN